MNRIFRMESVLNHPADPVRNHRVFMLCQEDSMTATSCRFAGPIDVSSSPRARLQTLPGNAVSFTGGVWTTRQAANRASALPHGFRMLEDAGNLENLRLSAQGQTTGYRGPVF